MWQEGVTLPPPSQIGGARHPTATPISAGPPLRRTCGVFMEAVLNAAMDYQALHLPDHHHTLKYARQQETKVWARYGGWTTSFPEEAIMAH